MAVQCTMDGACGAPAPRFALMWLNGPTLLGEGSQPISAKPLDFPHEMELTATKRKKKPRT